MVCGGGVMLFYIFGAREEGTGDLKRLLDLNCFEVFRIIRSGKRYRHHDLA